MNDLYSLVARQGPEAELLLLSGQANGVAQDDPRVGQLLGRDLDWPALLGMARRHAMMPRLLEMLSSAGWQGVPPVTRAEIEVDFNDNAARNLAMVAELNRIIKICRANDIPVISVKGPLLSHQLYGNFAMRVCLDLDLLVSCQDAARLITLLGSAGYQDIFGLHTDHYQAYLKLQHQLPLAKENAPWLVEVHTALLSSGSKWTTLESLIQHTEEVQIGGVKTTVLTAEQLFTYLCVHGTKHCWRRLGWLCDIAQLVGVHPDLDWELIHQWSRQVHYERAVCLSLELAENLLGLESDAGPRRLPKSRAFQSLAEDVATKLLRPQEHEHDARQRVWFHVRSRERLVDAAGSICEPSMKPTLADWQFLPLPASLWSFYYVVRPLRLLGRYSVAMLRRATGTKHRARQPDG